MFNGHMDIAGVHLGMIHSPKTLAQRIAVASKILPQFGVAAYCGFGRTPPAEIPAILDDHRRALALAGFAPA